jgi:ankyrin repeat protein
VVELFLQAGMNPNSTGDWDWPALLQAASGGHAGAVELLLEAGAPVDDTCCICNDRIVF